jgi:membrane-associated phospholipid phosphatase
LVSDVVSPPVVWTVIAFPLALATDQVTGSDAVTTATLYGFIVCWLPVMFIGWMVRCGHITDIHMKVRKQRILPFGVSITCSAGGLGLLWLLKASSVLLLFGTATLLGLVLMAVVTIFWQISIHAMSISSAVMVTAIVFGASAALWLVPLIPVVAAARLKLNRHTPAQLLAGGAVGALVPYLVFLV